MSETIEPALSPEEWGRRGVDRANETISERQADGTWVDLMCYLQNASHDEYQLYVDDSLWGPKAIPALIALANAALPDGHPQKVTRDWIEDLRVVADETEQDTIALFDSEDDDRPDRYIAKLRRIANVLESMLPPDTERRGA